jgi:hypothetical protein
MSLQAQTTLTDEEEKLYKERVAVKIEELQENLSAMASKEYDSETKQTFQEVALRLFMNQGQGVTAENSTIDLNTQKEVRKRQPIKTYFQRLCNLPYATVKLTKTQVCKISNLYKKGDDENGNPIYSATAAYFQGFEGYDKDGRLVYRDKVMKTVTIELHKTTDVTGGRWAVLFGDIQVAGTKVK